MRIEDEKSRQFYADKCVKSNWSVRQLKRQIDTFYYERLLASQDKDSVANEMGLPEKVESKNIVRDPYVLEFLGLEGKKSFYEKDLEQAIIDHLQNHAGEKIMIMGATGFATGKHLHFEIINSEGEYVDVNQIF